MMRYQSSRERSTSSARAASRMRSGRVVPTMGMMPVGCLEEKVKAFCEHVRRAEQDGEPVKDDPRARHAVARSATELEVSRMLQRRVISAALKQRVPTTESSEYKLFMNETGQRVADRALDVMGPDAQLRADQPGAPVEGRFERSYRYTVVDTIGGGASEIQKNIIARRALGLPRNF